MIESCENYEQTELDAFLGKLELLKRFIRQFTVKYLNSLIIVSLHNFNFPIWATAYHNLFIASDVHIYQRALAYSMMSNIAT